MSDPLVPNYVNGVGRLVTDRFDFQKHVDGYSFRHDANQIDLSPSVVVDGYVQTTVQDAVQLLSTYIVPPTIPDATTSSKGIIQLSGDLDGTASSVTVTGLQTQPVSSIVPTAGEVLTYNAGGYWEPAASANPFVAGGDLYGTNTTQFIQSLTGDSISNYVTILGNRLTFEKSLTGLITQEDATTGSAGPLYIKAQSTTDNNFDGAALVLSGGDAGGGVGLKGAVQLSTGGTNTTLLELAEVVQNQLVLSLCKTTALTSIEMPSGTGSGVIYIANAATDPSVGNPQNGAILYASGADDELRVRKSDGTDFAIGSIPNPSYWGPSGEQTITYRRYVTSTNSRALALRYVIPNNTSIKVDVQYVGRQQSPSTDTYEQNWSMGYACNNAGAVTNVGAIITYDLRTSGGAVGWNVPQFTIVGNQLDIETGYFAMTTIRWLVVIQLTVCSGV